MSSIRQGFSATGKAIKNFPESARLSNQGWRAVVLNDLYKAVAEEGRYEIFREWPPAIRFAIYPSSRFSGSSPASAKFHSRFFFSLSDFWPECNSASGMRNMCNGRAKTKFP